jgi:tetratricopeptide (TPR) repeat protein
MSPELPSAIHERIVHLSAEGDALAREKKYGEAIRTYREAWDLLLEPKSDWEAAAWLLAAIGDAYFFSKRFDKSLETFTQAIVNTSDGLGNPFLHLRRGESLFELDRKKEAADELMRAYMGGGSEIFESEDPRYLAYLKTVAKL